ncbi:MAG: hypothetical protein JWM27_2041 [Gemmatimonadetes bacterium]|nr:hypothetical protein [Gemmatimonadota bacterium]
MSFSRILMTAGAAVLALAGLAASFLPDEILRWSGTPAGPAPVLLVQVAGALYLGFAALDWMSRHTLIGGIYGRPVLTANLLHFLCAALACGKLVAGTPAARFLWPVALVYAVFAAGFGALMFRDPLPASTLAPAPAST